MPQRASLCSEKDAFLRRKAIVVRIHCHAHSRTHSLSLSHTHTNTTPHTHTHTHTKTYKCTYITGCRCVDLYCCAFLRLQSYHHHIRHIMKYIISSEKIYCIGVRQKGGQPPVVPHPGSLAVQASYVQWSNTFSARMPTPAEPAQATLLGSATI